jgi:hypothetical protein
MSAKGLLEVIKSYWTIGSFPYNTVLNCKIQSLYGPICTKPLEERLNVYEYKFILYTIEHAPARMKLDSV